MSLRTSDVLESKRNHAHQVFRDRLLDGTLRAGSTLTQQELLDILGISLTPLRELLVLLEDCNLVEIRQRSGITITYPDVGFIRQNLQFRSILEVSAMPGFAADVDRGWVERQTNVHEAFRNGIGTCENVDLRTALEQIDRDFHDAIVRSLDNGILLKTYRRTMDNVALAQLVHRRNYSVPQISDTIEEHLTILDRIARGDGQGAVETLQAHFRASAHRIIGV